MGGTRDTKNSTPSYYGGRRTSITSTRLGAREDSSFLSRIGLVCDRHEKELMELFSTIEATRINRKGGSGNKRGDKVGNHRNRELKQLECTMNYDVKVSATMSGKGRYGTFC